MARLITPLILLLLGSGFTSLSAQGCLVYEVPFPHRVQQSSHIIEGLVVNQQAFWNAENTRIYTAHEVRLDKIFKGLFSTTHITVITEGGELGNHLHVVRPELSLAIGDWGMFLLEPFTAAQAPGPLPAFRNYAAEQGFMHYHGPEAIAPFDHFTDIETGLYPAIVQITGQAYQTVNQVPGHQPHGQGFRGLVPVISSFTPDTVTAGTFTLLTINGSGFGTHTGPAKVEFRNSNDGGTTWIVAPANHIQSWSSSQITVWVPTEAGTGNIRITDDLGATATSSNVLRIRYNLSNIVAGGTYYRPVMRNVNTSGGVNLQYNANFANYTQAVDAFERALETWRCNTYVNFDLPGLYTFQGCQGADNISVINWDTACALPAGLLGRTFTYFQGCVSPLTLYMTDVDIIFKKNLSFGSWYFGTGTPGFNQFDFETVALHELGHAHLLGHVIDPGQVMHYQMMSGSVQRVLSNDDVAGGNDVMNLSTTPATCGPSAMQALNSGNCAISQPMASFIAIPREGCVPLEVFFIDQSGQNPTAWQWDLNGDGIIDDTVQNPTYLYTAPGNYNVTLIVTNANGVDTLTQPNFITVYPLPVADAGSDVALCSGDTVTIGGIIPGSGGTGFLSYQWAPSSGLSNPLVGNPRAFPSTTTIYTLTVTDQKGCQGKDSVIVSTVPKPTADAGPDLDLCEGEQVKLGGTPTGSGGSGQLSYFWSPDILLIDPTAANPDFTANASATFIVTVTDTNQCSARDTVVITVNPNPTADAGQDFQLCQGQQQPIGGSPSASGGTPGYTYIWQPFQGISNSSIANPLASPITSTTYSLLVIDSKGCDDIDTVRIAILPKPSAEAGNNQTICVGTPLTLGGNPTASGGIAPYIYGWLPVASVDNPAASNPAATPDSTTTYSLTVLDANNCIGTDTVRITVRPTPVANAGSDKALCGGLASSVMIGGNPAGSGGTGSLAYGWLPTFGLSNPNVANPTATPGNPISYTLTVTDANGCFDRDTMSITVNPPLVALAGADDTICNGECIPLGAVPSAIGGDGNYTYLWVPSTGNPPPAVANPTVCPSVTATYTLSVTDGKSCQAFDEVRIVVRPSPTVSFTGLDTSYCTNSPSATLTGNPPAGTFSGPGISGTTFSPAAAGTGTHAITFAFTGGNGCTGHDTSFTTVHPAPTKPSITKSNDTLYADTGYAAYLWLFNGIPIVSADKRFFTGLVPGSYEVIGYAANGCGTRSDAFVYTNVSGPEALGLRTTLHPNPAANTALLQLHSDVPISLDISVWNTMGQQVQRPLHLEVNGHYTHAIQVAHLASGMYFIRLASEGKTSYLKLVKK